MYITDRYTIPFDNDKNKELIKSLSDVGINMRVIDIEEVENFFKVEVVNNHVYVIIQKGFFNFKFLNIPDFHLLFIKSLMVKLFRFFSEKQVQNSSLFLGLVLTF